MKSRMNILLIACAVMLVAITWLAVRGQKSTDLAATTGPAAVAPQPVLQIRVVTIPPTPAAAPAPVARPQLNLAATLAGSIEPAPATQPAGYTAVQGDTLSNVAAGLLGHDSKKNRDAVIAGNPALAADPDRVLAGKTYQLSDPAAASPAAAQTPSVVVPPAAPEVPNVAHSSSDRVLKYTAQPGDSVSALAAGLLGADSKENRDAIIGENKSLQRDPDHVESGKTYKIPTSEGLSAAPAPAVETRSTATTQPDADQIVKVGTNRELRYTARGGDTVSKLAQVLLGSDTQENRDAIINNNVSLKGDPDRVIAGQTYWIPAPAATLPQP